jgi:hypothetical protein
MKLAAAATKAACIDMQLVQERDGKHGLAADIVFSEPEIATIEALNPTLRGTIDRQKNIQRTVSPGRVLGRHRITSAVPLHHRQRAGPGTGPYYRWLGATAEIPRPVTRLHPIRNR